MATTSNAWRRKCALLPLLVAALALVAAPGFPYLVDNVEFTTDLTGWTAGTWEHDSTMGLFLIGSARATGMGAHTISQCAAVTGSDPAGSLGGAATFRTDYDAVPAGYTIRVELFTTANCVGSPVDSHEHSPPEVAIDDAWFTVFVAAPMQAGVQSARLTAEVDHGSENLTTFLDVPNLRDNLAAGTDFTNSSQVDLWTQNPPEGVVGDLTSHDTVTTNFSLPVGALELEVGPVPARGTDGGYSDVRQCRNLSDVPPSRTLFSYLHVLTPRLPDVVATPAVHNAEIAYIWYDGSNCSGMSLGVDPRSVQPGLFNIWWGFIHFIPVPSDAVSLQLVFIINPKPLADGGSDPGAKVLFDDWILAPSDAIFFGDFESGDTTDW